MKKLIFIISIFILLVVSSCKKSPGPVTDYLQLQQNGSTTFYSVNSAYWQVIDTGKGAGKYYYIKAFQAFTDSLNYVLLEFRDNTTPDNSFCPANSVYGDLNAPSSGCSDSAKSCTGFSITYYSTAYGQFTTTADSISPPTQLNVFICNKGFQELSATFQGRVSYGGQAISITNGQFNNVVFANQ